MVWFTPTKPPVRTSVRVSAPEGKVVAPPDAEDGAGAEAEPAAVGVVVASGEPLPEGETPSVAVHPVSRPAARSSASVVRSMSPWCPAGTGAKPPGWPRTTEPEPPLQGAIMWNGSIPAEDVSPV